MSRASTTLSDSIDLINSQRGRHTSTRESHPAWEFACTGTLVAADHCDHHQPDRYLSTDLDTTKTLQ